MLRLERTPTLDALIREVDRIGSHTLVYGKGPFFAERLHATEEFWLERAKRHYVGGLFDVRELEMRVRLILEHFSFWGQK